MSNDLWRYFLTNPGRPIVKLPHYFPIYERHFEKFRGRPVTVIEIGVAAGGSLEMWRAYFGEKSRVFGLDIDPACLGRVDSPNKVLLGDQADPSFLSRVIEVAGPPDIVIDDGSHRQDDVNASFDFLYPRLSIDGVYLVEDLHSAYWKEYCGEGLTFMERCKRRVDELHAHYSRGSAPTTDFTQSTESIHVYDSVVVFEKGPHNVLPPAVSWGKASNLLREDT